MMIIILLTILLIGAAALITYFLLNDTEQTGEPTIDEMLEATWETKEITTNLAKSDMIRIQFKIQMDNKKAKEEIEKRDFQIYNIIITELSKMEASNFNEGNGLAELEERVKTESNHLLQDGNVDRVYTTMKIIQ